MVQKSVRRGRPRAYDPDVALARAMDVFWDKGYAATSLDDLSEATGMNRPSLYAAFGDKNALYGKALAHYRAMATEEFRTVFAEGRSLRETMRDFYGRGLAMYLSPDKGPRGCFIIGTALTEAITNRDVRGALAASVKSLDDVLRARFERAVKEGDLPRDADPAALARVAAAMLYLLAIRARAGDSRASLEATIDAAVDTICGPEKSSRKAKTR